MKISYQKQNEFDVDDVSIPFFAKNTYHKFRIVFFSVWRSGRCCCCLCVFKCCVRLSLRIVLPHKSQHFCLYFKWIVSLCLFNSLVWAKHFPQMSQRTIFFYIKLNLIIFFYWKTVLNGTHFTVRFASWHIWK
jgi:hypothetical protein